ncbi:uncharacterized protein BXZ73DRAFT_96077 [Epithele typhae]|uniref:uncharacterized protein n=1 Tax=Epithele typhae TaxID=378194 RepID=UPI0020082A04|nr:uncharacterized protein BXZ73DRAFT_96077 [Epithele typhae]KAH9945096.1 hypothetical protein BXZ73DRAFT_96077 [Epithele typhae]
MSAQFLAEYGAFVESVLDGGVKLGAWDLQLIGIKRSCHKKGAGKALLEAVEAGLETMAGGAAVKMYEAVGYTMQGTGSITWVNGAQLAKETAFWYTFRVLCRPIQD